MKWLIALAILASAVALLLTICAPYSDAQEATPTPSLYDQLPTVLYAHPSDVNYSGAVNVIDLFLVAGDFGQRGAPAVCAHIIVAGDYFGLAAC